MAASGLPDLIWSCGPTDGRAEAILRGATVELHGRMPWSSNATFLVSVGDGEGETLPAIYKPERGEQPLWDFPAGLWRREIATYRLSRLLGWAVIPPTVENSGPLGVGSMQSFVEADYDEHYFTFGEEAEHAAQLRQICLLDLIANNTDRKAGHILHSDRRLWGIDNGLSFHTETKVRTVIWDFAGEPMSAEEREALSSLSGGGFAGEMEDLLTADEIDAALGRLRSLIEAGEFPVDRSGRGYPWPLV